MTITYEDLDADSIGVTSITPEKILTPCLSALSANMGCLTAGVIQGGCFQTGSGGARTLIDSYGIRSYDTNCCMLFSVCNGDFQLSTALSGARIQFNAGGIFGYDGSGNKTLEIKNGCFWGQQLKLEDPACACNYSFLDSGRLKFHDVYGDVPYITRICNGTVCTGAWVTLPGWKAEPKVILSVKELQSYNCSNANACQKWIIYHDTPVCYCNSAIDYGYCFLAHACLLTSGSVGNEIIKDVNFGTAVCTGTNACETLVRHRFQLWCNAACANYYYGVICYAVCYRVLGSGIWCACCFNYTQAHANLSEMQNTQNKCDNMIFPCGACWEVMSSEVSFSWIDSGISSATTQCFLCSRPVTACTIARTISWICCQTASCVVHSCCIQYVDSIALGGTKPSNVYCTYLCYCVSDYVNKVYAFVCHCTPSSGFTCSVFCYRTDFGLEIHCQSACILRTCCGVPTCGFCSACANTLGLLNLSAYNACAFTCLEVVSRFCHCWCQQSIGFMRYWHIACDETCIPTGTLYHCYCTVSGSAGSCCYRNLYTLKDTFASSTVLDPAGCLNWLAISYN